MRFTARASPSLGLLLALSNLACSRLRSAPALSNAAPPGSGASRHGGSEATRASLEPVYAGTRTAGAAHGCGDAAVARAPSEVPHRAALEGMLPVPGGTFVMGSDAGGQGDEHPAHQVTLRSFLLDRTEVTNGAYAACVSAGVCRAPEPASATGSHFGPDAAFRGPEQPVSSISWDDARAYCAFAGKRLPTEAEFERAARGEDQRVYPWGNEPPTPERAVFGTSRTANVATHPEGAGPYGHLDLSGNVWEWTRDVYDPEAYRRPGADRGVPGTCDEVLAAQDALRRAGREGFTGSNPIPKECERVLRGGAFNYGGEGLRASNRVHHPARFRLVMSGVRCAKDAP